MHASIHIRRPRLRERLKKTYLANPLLTLEVHSHSHKMNQFTTYVLPKKEGTPIGKTIYDNDFVGVSMSFYYFSSTTLPIPTAFHPNTYQSINYASKTAGPLFQWCDHPLCLLLCIQNPTPSDPIVYRWTHHGLSSDWLCLYLLVIFLSFFFFKGFLYYYLHAGLKLRFNAGKCSRS